MTDLPEIPEVVLRAIRFEAPWLSEHDVHVAAHTVWPHLYAAALRHAAERITEDNRTPAAMVYARVIRRMADEATL